MKTTYTEVMDAVNVTKVVAQEIQNYETISLLEEISKKYLDKNKKGGFLWERLLNYEWSSNPDAWKWISDFIGDNDVIMFFLQNGNPKAFQFSGGTDVVEVFGETGGFDMYITNEDIEYFFAYSHHDVLYACGSAKQWLENYNGDN